MKRILFLIILLSTSVSLAQLNVWRWQNPLPTGDELHAVQMFSLNNIYVCGENGMFMRTTDGGQTWDIQTNILKFHETFNTLSFPTSTFGMCAGDSGVVIKTTDGGSTWKLSKTGTLANINGILVIDTNIAIIVTSDGANGSILKTTNGGATWTPIPNEGLPQLWSIRMLRPDFITITGDEGTILRSYDECSTPLSKINIIWDGKRLSNSFYCANFTDGNTGSVLDDGLVFHTTDGGTSWTLQKLDNDTTVVTAGLKDIGGKDPNIFCIAGNHGTLLYTTDGGQNWKQSYIETIGNLYAISFFNKLNATAVGRDGVILRTTNGGKDWFYLPQVPEVRKLQSIAFPKGDTSLGVAVGYGGLIMRTTDGGKLWKVIPNALPNILRSVTFLDATNLIAVGDLGLILKSTDAGETWTKQIQFTKFDLYSVSFATPTDGIAVGDSNTILRTTTAGLFWTVEFNPGALMFDNEPVPVPKPGFTAFLSVSYPDEMHAYIGSVENFYTSDNGGITWVDNWLPRMIPSLSFTDSLHGGYVYILACDGCIYVYVNFTTDGGKTWINEHLVGDIRYNFLNAIQCVDNMHATAVGNSGYIGHTTDGGVTWNEQQSNTPNDLFGVCFGTVKAGTAVGLRGNIVRITTDEEPPLAVKNEASEPAMKIDAYPNPSTDFVTIRYSLLSPGLTKLEIYSVGGTLISSLPEEYKSSGDYSIGFNATGMASGAYMCKITCNGASVEREIIIQR